MMKFIKDYWWIILIGFGIRLLIASVTFHPDVKIVNYTSAVILREHSLNPYDYWSNLDKNDIRKLVYSLEVPDDLPLQYWLRIPIDLITRFLINPDIEYQFLSNTSVLFGNPLLWLHLILIKFSLIFFDLALGITLALLFRDAKQKKALFYWMFNPMTLWATSAIGQVDVLPVFFVVLAILLADKNKLSLSALSLGIGGAIKSFPFLISLFLIFLARSWRDRIKLFFITCLPVVISVFPYLPSKNFRANALMAPQLDKMFYAKIPLSGGESIFITIGLLFLLYILYLRKNRSCKDFVNFSFSSLLLILAFTHFHIQWFLWITPFLLYYLAIGANSLQKWSIVLLFISLLLMLFLFESSLQLNLLAPLFPELKKISGLAEVFSPDKINFLRTIAASVFSSAALALSADALLKSERESKITD